MDKRQSGEEAIRAYLLQILLNPPQHAPGRWSDLARVYESGEQAVHPAVADVLLEAASLIRNA